MVVPPTDLDPVRRELRSRRQRFVIGDKDHFIPHHPLLERLLAAAQCVGLYRPMSGEPDPLPLLRAYSGDTALPSITANLPHMIFRRWSEGDPLIKSPWGGHQPTPDAETVTPDFIFVPLLGFDEALNRIGQGGGHYDRYLAAHPFACRIGLAWACQRVETMAPRSWDVPMDGILTEATFHIKDLTRCRHP